MTCRSIGASPGRLGDRDPRFWVGGHRSSQGSPGVVDGSSNIILYVIMLSRTVSMFESGDF